MEDLMDDIQYIHLWSHRLLALGRALEQGQEIAPMVDEFWVEARDGVEPGDIVLTTIDGGRVRVQFSIKVDSETL